MKKGTRSKKSRRGGGVVAGFFNFGMPRDFRSAERVEQLTRAEQLHDLARIQKARPLKPPPCKPAPHRSQAAEKDAARYEATQINPEINHCGVGIYYGGREGW